MQLENFFDNVKIVDEYFYSSGFNSQLEKVEHTFQIPQGFSDLIYSFHFLFLVFVVFFVMYVIYYILSGKK